MINRWDIPLASSGPVGKQSLHYRDHVSHLFKGRACFLASYITLPELRGPFRPLGKIDRKTPDQQSFSIRSLRSDGLCPSWSHRNLLKWPLFPVALLKFNTHILVDPVVSFFAVFQKSGLEILQLPVYADHSLSPYKGLLTRSCGYSGQPQPLTLPYPITCQIIPFVSATFSLLSFKLRGPCRRESLYQDSVYANGLRASGKSRSMSRSKGEPTRTRMLRLGIMLISSSTNSRSR